ncbi:MAG: hypothetical protein J6D11_04635 [Clostridia bacterium]|nr:hypothetical protein [Clostridia bacterium]
MTNEEIRQLQDILDGRYVRKKDCARAVDKTEEHINELRVFVTKIGTKLNIITGILGAIGTAVLAAVVKIIIGG